MKIDLHIHSSCSDGQLSPLEIFREASERGISIISITDHDSTECQEEANVLAREYNIGYICGLELSVTFSAPEYIKKSISLDFLAYQYDIKNRELSDKLRSMREYRRRRAEEILKKVNLELVREDKPEFDDTDLKEIENSVDGAFGRPHIADYMVKKGIANTRREAFDKYLVKCNVPKMPLSLPEASELVRGAGGLMVFAHPNHPRGTSLIKLTNVIEEQQNIIRKHMLPYIDGIECWHSEHDNESVNSYLDFAKEMGLIVTGGSDCHQRPLIMGTVDVPSYVADQFNIR